MLVLARKVDEKILIGDNIVIFPIRISGNTVRLGIQAPSDVLILREELLHRERKTDDVTNTEEDDRPVFLDQQQFVEEIAADTGVAIA